MSGMYGFSLGFPLGKSSGWKGRPSACHSIPTTFLREIPRKTHTFLTLVNKNIILYRIGVTCFGMERGGLMRMGVGVAHTERGRGALSHSTRREAPFQRGGPSWQRRGGAVPMRLRRVSCQQEKRHVTSRRRGRRRVQRRARGSMRRSGRRYALRCGQTLP